MDDFALFVCGVVVTLIAGMGVITSQVFMGYSKHVTKPTEEAKAKREAVQRTGIRGHVTSTSVWVADTGAIQASKDRVLGIFTSVRCRLVRLGMVEAIRQWQDNRRCYGMPKG